MVCLPRVIEYTKHIYMRRIYNEKAACIIINGNMHGGDGRAGFCAARVCSDNIKRGLGA